MITFKKYQGTGNDFIIIDNRDAEINFSKAQVASLCDRRFGIGADGLMLLENAVGYDFKMVYYNADGGESTMCGNGGRCLVKFAHDIGIMKEKYSFIAIDGEHEATIDEQNWVLLKMIDVTEKKLDGANFVLNTGSPHYIQKQENLKHFDVYTNGKNIRYNDTFKNEGINVNFVEPINENSIFVRTYERGVEDETYSCGTGVTAAAIAFAYNNDGFNKVNIKTLGGELSVLFDKANEQLYTNVWLCGPAKFVFNGTIEI